MTTMPTPCGRRAWLLRVAALAASPLGTGPATAAAPAGADRRFAALTRTALPVRQPAKAALLGAAFAGRRIVSVGERGVVALSDDEGRSWRQAAAVPTSVTLTAVRFANADHGWAVGHGGVILATEDAGEHWALQADGLRLAVLAQEAAAARVADGDARGVGLAKEAGLLVADGPDKPLLDLLVIDANRVVVAGAYNLFFETKDGGRHWRSALDRLDNPKAQHLYAMRARGDTWLVVGEQGLLLRSRDGGRSFQRLASPYAGSWFAIALTPQGRWIAAGLRGNAFASDDDGEHWTRLDGAPPTSFVGASALPDGSVLLSNQAGQIFVARPGAALTALPGPNLPPVSQLLPLPGGDLLAVGLAGAIRLPATPS